MLTGEFEISSDEKGRIFIPNKLKEELAGETLYLTKVVGLPCLQIMRSESFEKVKNVLFAKDTFVLNAKVASLQRLLIAPSVEFKIADRLLIPQSLRNYAEIKSKSEVVLLGLIDRIEIWEKETYARYSESQSEEVQSDADELCRIMDEK